MGTKVKTKIFTYKGWIGIQSSENSEGLIAKPGGGNMGVVLSTSACEITPEAKAVFKNAGREGGSFASFMLTEHAGAPSEHGKSSIGWLGGYLNAAPFSAVKLGRDCNKSVLEDMTEVADMEIPIEFMDFIDKQ